MCRAQYPGSVASAALTHPPVTFEAYRTVGARSRTCSATHPVSSSAIGASIREWKACVVASARAGMPRSAASFCTALTAAGGPATTHCVGPLTAATSTSRNVGDPCRSSVAAVADKASATIPPAGSALISRARCATRRNASGSDSTPAIVAATYSPRL